MLIKPSGALRAFLSAFDATYEPGNSTLVLGGSSSEGIVTALAFGSNPESKGRKPLETTLMTPRRSMLQSLGPR